MSHNALGYQFAVRCPDQDLDRWVRELLVGLASPPDTCAVPALPVVTVRSEDADPLASLLGALNLRAVVAADGALLLHAGALAEPGGGVAVLCGPSGSGKSTLTAVLALRGCGYVTDETVSLDPVSLEVMPFRKPLALKRGAWPVLPDLTPDIGSVAARFTRDQVLVTPAMLGPMKLPAGPLEPELIVLPTYQEGAATRIDRLGEAEAAYHLSANTSRLRNVRGGGLPALARLARRAPAYRLVHGDVHAAADEVQRLWAQAS